jgi:co-chaperonin GroES (HSP10)
MTTNNSNYTAVHNRVLLRAEANVKSKGGILLPNESTDKEAVIVDIGPDAFKDWLTPPKVGDKVLHFGATEVKTGPDREKYYITEDEKIAVVVHEVV